MRLSPSRSPYPARADEMDRTDHIISSFSTQLHALATTDSSLAKSGVTGGVAGFVQSVLVPELAVSLICEDLDLAGSDKAAVGVLAESAEVGELLNPELEERVVVEGEDEGGGGMDMDD